MDFTPKRPLTKELLAQLPPLCTDGAWGTELQKLGAKPGEIVDEWNLTAPEKVLQVARAYVEAGAQVILTNTFNSNRLALERHGLADKAAEFSLAGAKISREAAGDEAYVFASLGPSGKILMMGETTAQQVEDAYAEQAEALAKGGVDALLLETQTDLEEVAAQLAGCKKACDLPVGCSFTFDSGADNDRTMMGVTIEQAWELARDNGAAFVGANCGAGMETFVGIARKFREAGCTLPLWIKGNAGLPELDEHGNTVFKSTPEDFEAVVADLLEAGAKFIGGCCGSTAAHVRAIRLKMDEILGN